MTEPPDQLRRLACLDVHGGNREAAFAADLPGLSAWVWCRPLHPSPRGGDLYYMTSCGHGVIARVVVADVSGHGGAVSAGAARLHSALRRTVEEWDQTSLVQ